MAAAVLTKPGTESAHPLRDIVEQSIAVLCERDEAAAKKAQVRASRFLPLHADRASVQKAALTNAAKALAALWNVSRTGRAKHSRGLQFASMTAQQCDGPALRRKPETGKNMPS